MTSESPSKKKRRTWFPIVFGILCGMIAFVLLTTVERPSFYRLTVLIFNETSPKALFAKPAYYCVHRTILLALAAIGGDIGVWFSEWPKTRSLLFLMVSISIVGVFAAVGFH
jgi:hypothetical protein